jgi:hypothetical protein
VFTIIKIVLIVIISVYSLNLFSDWVELQYNSQKQLFEELSSNFGTTQILFTLDGYDIENISDVGKTFQKISYWNEGEFIEAGKPNLPRFTRLVTLSNEGDVSIELINYEVEIISNIIVYPSQELQSESKPPKNHFSFDENYYLEGEIFPSQIVEIGNPAIMRDLRVVNVTINPFQYDPQTQELKIYKNVEFVINCERLNGANPKRERTTRSRSFESIYKSSVINYKAEPIWDEVFHQPNYLFIYPNNTQVESVLQDLIDWKKQKGFHVVSVSTSQTGTTLNAIKSYIQNAYDTWENPPEFICLIGDAGGIFSIPTDHLDGGEGDHSYVLLEGNDILADAFIGRLSFNSIFELQTIIYKILHYEKEPYLGNTNWYNKALLVGDPTTSGQSCVDTKISIKEMISQYSDNFSFNEVYSAPWVSQISNGFNEGVSYFNYRGYYGMSGWDLNEISNLNNDFMLPVAVLLTCSVGDFEGTYDSRTERFLKAGSPGNPKGAIAAIGTATSDTNTCFNNCVDAGIYYGIFVDRIYHLGGALNRGKLNLFNCYPNNPYNSVYKFSYWNNLMGDPGMEIWTSTPEPMTVTYNSLVPIGSNLSEVIVTTNAGNPIENAWVTILKEDDEIFSTGYTDDIGMIYLPIEANSTGEVNLTVTKHNYIPHLGNFNIIQNDVFINVFEINIDDDNIGSSSGNGNGMINPGESIELNISLENFGSITANSVTASITSEDDFITITDNAESYGNIPAGSSTYSSDDFDFSIDSNVLDSSELIIDITIQGINNNQWDDKIYLTIEGANLQPVSYSVIDGNNAVLDPGETVEFTVTIENSGTVTSDQVSGFLFCSNNQITIADPVGYFGNITPGNQLTNETDRFIISANQEIIHGTQINMELQLYNPDGYDNTISFIIEVGEVFITDPFGPDEYGYYCYDDGDSGYELAPVYNWIEIDPNYGGSGTVVTLYDFGDMGDIEDLEIPFVLRFYGINYTTMTVCSNGWIAPGSTEQMSFMNWSIHGPLGPSPIIAPFWDDLKTGSGNVCYFYDQIQNYFVIEWSHLQNDYDNSEETFQVILFDSNHYPTITGDSKILFQYKTINNVDQGNYGTFSNHGEFATVGLEDHTGVIGLEYTYSNQYPTAAKVLEDEMAILFTTSSVPNQGPFIILDSFEIDDSQGNNNGIVNPGELVELSITLRNVGVDNATNVSATLLSSDLFISIGDSIQYFGDINPSSISTSLGNYSFDVEIICPDQHDIIFDLNVNADNDYEWFTVFIVEVLTPDITTSEDTINFDEIFVGYPESKQLTISNLGSDVLHVSDIITDNPDFSTNITAFELDAEEYLEIEITVNTNSLGVINGNLIIISNDPDEPEKYISLLGMGVDLIPPNISVYPDFFYEELNPCETSIQILTVFNDGESILTFNAENTNNSGAGKAAIFNGINNYIEINHSASLNISNEITIETWFNPNTLTTPIGWEALVQKAWIIHDEPYYLYTIGYANIEYRGFFALGVEGVYYNIVGSDQIVSTGNWYHLVGTYDGSQMKIYVNSLLINSYNRTGAIDTAITPLHIGRFSNRNSFFNGMIDEVRIWNYARTQTEIQNTMNYTLVGDEPGLMGYWNFNGDNPWNDLSINGNDGVPQGDIFTIDSTAPINDWLSVFPISASIPTDSSLDIEITFDASVLENGIYETVIVINSNDPNNPEINIPVTLTISSVGIDNDTLPSNTNLNGNYPNPFNPNTLIKYQISEENKVELNIYNIKGQLVKTLINQVQSAGKYEAIWNGTNENNQLVTSGVYLYLLKTGNQTYTKKMLLMK